MSDLVKEMLSMMEKLRDVQPRRRGQCIMSVKAASVLFGISEDEVRRRFSLPPQCKSFMLEH